VIELLRLEYEIRTFDGCAPIAEAAGKTMTKSKQKPTSFNTIYFSITASI
jgi:hypothetical protein